MTDYSKTTKAQMAEELASYAEKVKDLTRQLDAIPPRPALAAVPEATALANCIRALDPLANERRNSDFFHNPSGSIDRTLRTLAAKYGVNLVEVRTEPCGRAHVDEIDMSRVHDAIQSRARNNLPGTF